MKVKFSVRLPKELVDRMKNICVKEGGRSHNSFIEEATAKLVKEKENSKDEE